VKKYDHTLRGRLEAVIKNIERNEIDETDVEPVTKLVESSREDAVSRAVDAVIKAEAEAVEAEAEAVTAETKAVKTVEAETKAVKAVEAEAKAGGAETKAAGAVEAEAMAVNAKVEAARKAVEDVKAKTKAAGAVEAEAVAVNAKVEAARKAAEAKAEAKVKAADKKTVTVAGSNSDSELATSIVQDAIQAAIQAVKLARATEDAKRYLNNTLDLSQRGDKQHWAVHVSHLMRRTIQILKREGGKSITSEKQVAEKLFKEIYVTKMTVANWKRIVATIIANQREKRMEDMREAARVAREEAMANMTFKERRELLLSRRQ
jgi:hypothetical protein